MSGISITGSAVYSSFNQVTLLRGGSAYFDRLLRMINEAKEVIHLQVYIYDEDETGSQISHALCEAAMRGVKVYIFLDGYSSKNLSTAFRKMMRDKGIKIRWFQPLLKSKYFYFGRRLHHKVVVVDGRQALVGGINISNRYNDFPDTPAWLDWAIWVQGETAVALEKTCIQLWNKSRLGLGKTIRQPQRHYNNNHHPICYVRVRRNDWVAGKVEVTRSYLEMMHRAQEEIIIMSSYFLPGSIIRNALAKAAKRGVKITLIISGISDVVLAKAAEKYWYPWIMRNQIRIFEYHRHILHGKISVYDRKWVTAGSYNVNNISAYASIELNLDILNESFGNDTYEALKKIMVEECKEITPQDFTRKTHQLALFWYWLNFEIYRLMLYLFTFYFKQKEKT